MQAQIQNVKQLVNVPFKLLSYNHDDCLIELENRRLLIVNTNEKTIHSSLCQDDGIQFEGTGYVKNSILTHDDLLKNNDIILSKQERIQLIMRILKLDSPIGWSEVDYIEYHHLSLVHYDDDADMTKVGHLRGVLVDLKNHVVLASSFGHTPSVVLDQIQFDHGLLQVVDEHGYKHDFHQDDISIKRAYEGTIMRVIYYGGEVYRLIHRKIRPLKSRWGNSPFFTKIYHEAGGPKDDQLFNLDKKYSPYCYVFVVVHPQLLLATKKIVKTPFVKLLSIQKMWETDKDHCPFPLDDVDDELNFNKNLTISLMPEDLTLDEANHHLKCGYSNTRLWPGEAVYIYKKKDGQIVDIVKINSPAYQYRYNLRGNDPNPYHRFFELVHHSYCHLSNYADYVDFKNKFVILDENMNITEMSENDKNNRDAILQQIWRNYVMALPHAMQQDAMSYLQKFINERDQLIQWLYTCHNACHQLDVSLIGKYGVTLILQSRQNGKNLFFNSKNNNGKFKNLNSAVLTSIEVKVNNTNGENLYSLIKKMKECNK
ncbi:MAG TPA: hypothetical protein VLG50_07560 [Candidatus Saccharimonadales bacterium]|nr:hypothetical protein [Candidatus Saccharimonadales bacterium]